MHDVLVIGLSSIVKRRVLPALLTLERVGAVHVASGSHRGPVPVPEGRRGRVWDDYRTALRECPPCLAYVSVPNALHAPLVREALEHGFHVVVDKPAVTGDLASARDLVRLARTRSRVLAEATAWSWHPITDELRRLVGAGGAGPTAITMTFTSPPMDPGNFRYDRSLGGGALLDRGSYAASCGRLLFAETPTSAECVVFTEPGRDVDVAAAMTLTYPTGVLMGYVSLASEYRNHIEIVAPHLSCSAERVFSPPADFDGLILVHESNSVRAVPTPPDDCFARFLDAVLDAVEQEDHDTFSTALLADAGVLARLVASAEGTAS